MENNMTKGEITPILLKFLFPIFIGNIFLSLYNMVDMVIVGRYLGSDALAAVGATGTIIFLVMGFAQGMSSGFTVLTAQAYGAENKETVKESVVNAIILTVIVVIAITFISAYYMHGILRLMNTPKDIYDDAYRYIKIICYGTGAWVFYNLFSAFLRAAGNSRVPLYFLLFASILNIILDYVFIAIIGMDVGGAAHATNLSELISAILCAIYIYRKEAILKPERRHWKFYKEHSKNQLAIGVPMALQFSITAAGTMIMQAALNLFGSMAVASYTAACRLQGLLIQGYPALGQAMASYCGQNFGSQNYERLEKGIKTSVKINILYSIIVGILVITLLKPSLYLFFRNSTDIELFYPWAKTYIYISVLFYAFLGFIFVFRNAMQGCGYGILPMIGGVIELIARALTSYGAWKYGSYELACFGDGASWLTAGIFTMLACIYVLKDIKNKFGRENEYIR